MEDKLDLLLSKLNKLEETILEMKETIDAHRVEHGFAKMQDGGVNGQFDQSMGGPMGGQINGGGGGYQMPGMGGPMGPGMGGMPGPDPSRPPGF
jgi:hypothetical protein|tara:strand:+ start:424 stop:705 length:282 start_codon:yes stop_codon:yes gene_type:complete